VPDVAGKLPGRGLWLTARRDIVATAIAKRHFARAARQPVAVDDDLADRIEALMAARCRDEVALARRAGQAVMGFALVEAALMECFVRGDGSREEDYLREAVRCVEGAVLPFSTDPNPTRSVS